jgi:uncharacterized repeat protein (TIGR01451 family)
MLSLSSLSFYAKRLRKENITKLFIATTASLALILQLTTGVLPFMATTAQATGSDNIISQGAASKADLLAIYDRGADAAGHSDIKQIYTAMGISRDDLANGTIGTYSTNDFNGNIKTLGRTNYPGIGRTQLSIPGAQTAIYTGPFLDGYNNKTYPMNALIGKRSMDGQWFAITMNCGNIVYVVPPTPPAPKPVYTCDMLTVTPIDRTTVKFDTKYTVTNATFKSVTYVVRDSSGAEISRSSSATYSQSTPGSYTVEAIVTVDVNGQEKTATGASCKAEFTIAKEKTPAVTITKMVDGVKSKTVALNQEFTYQLHVTNTGEADLTNAVVTDTAPSGVTLVKADIGTITGNTWTTTLTSLKAGESKDFTLTGKVVSYTAGELVNTACVTSSQLPGAKPCDTATVNVPAPTPAAPAAPTQLPHTGLGSALSATFGLGSMIATGAYYVASRRSLFAAFIGQ